MAFFSLNLAALAACILIIMKQFRINNPFTNRVCKEGGVNDCNAVLSSKASKLTDWLSWGDVGLVYFSTSLMLLLIFPEAMSTLMLLAMGGIGYSFYSLGYQYSQRKFCTLCNIVQLCIVVEACIALYVFLQQGVYLPSALIIFQQLLVFLVVSVIWSTLRTLISNDLKLKSQKKKFLKLKFDHLLFSTMLSKQVQFKLPTELPVISVGNKEGNTVITLISNPYCDACAKVHDFFHEMLKYKSDVLVNIVFNGASSHTEISLPAKHMLTLAKSGDADKAIHDWYQRSSKDYLKWAHKYPATIDLESEKAVDIQHDWCTSNGIDVTPVVLVNGHLLPEGYQVEDLKYLTA